MMEQPREINGQFGFKDDSRQEAGQITLDFFDDGTFYYPPYPRDAQHVIKFCSTVEVPEYVAYSVDQETKNRRNTHYQYQYNKRLSEWVESQIGPEPPVTKWSELENWKKKKEALTVPAEKQEEWSEAASDATNEMYPSFDGGYLYPSIRAALMYEMAQQLPKDEQEKVLNVGIRFPKGIATPQKVWNYFGFHRLRDALKANPQEKALELQTQTAKNLSELNELEWRRRNEEVAQQDWEDAHRITYGK